MDDFKSMAKTLIVAVLFYIAVLALVFGFASWCSADSWIFEPSTYTHRDGKRVSQYETHDWVAPLPEQPREDRVSRWHWDFYWSGDGRVDIRYRYEVW